MENNSEIIENNAEMVENNTEINTIDSLKSKRKYTMSEAKLDQLKIARQRASQLRKERAIERKENLKKSKETVKEEIPEEPKEEMPEEPIEESIPETKFVDGVEFIPTMTNIGTLNFDLSRMVASKIMLKMSPDTPLKAAKPALNIGDVVSFQPAKEAQFPQRTILIVKAVDLKTATVTFTPTLWNRLNLNSPGVIKLRMIQNDKDAPTQIKFTNIEKMLFTATVPVMPKTEAGELTVTTKNQIEVEEISISLSKEQLDTIEPGASTITPTENKPFTLAAQSFIDDTTYQSFCGKIEGEASMVGTKE
eukprot:gene21982-26477_t